MTAINNVKAADPWNDLNLDDPELQELLDKPLDGRDNSRLRDGTQHEGFDSNLGDSWIYPSNLPCRSYQLSIVQAALYRNTLVVLPTGLGKTLIAAVVMYNIFRWYPRGKVIFMAPTRPLVNQQIEACQKIMSFPRKDIVELTGKLPKAKRAELWKTKRVFFATPQVVQSDILGGQELAEEDGESAFDDSSASTNKFEFPFDAIKLIVIDEAHKAKGKYAYTEVTQAIAARTRYFRVLALSATPGRTMEDVAEVCRNLLISHLEVRWDTSPDVLPYVHKRSMETVVVPLSDRIKETREELLEIIDPYLRQLIEADVLSGSLTNINRNFLFYEQKRFLDRSLHNGRHPQHSAISSNFATCISLYHSLELLERHGLRVFLNNFEEDIEGKVKYIIQMDRRLRTLVDNLKQDIGPNPFEVSAGPMTNGQIAKMPKDLDFGHPKFEKARECLLKHFQSEEEAQTRAIVFCEYRESVLLIYRMLLQHSPLLRPRCFVGQGGTGTLRALTQKQQIQIMNDFRSGKSNILIATSIGEEGIDVGEVDLIVCFDISTTNPTRFVQRIGRTGRKKNGNVVMLVTEGREQQILKDVLSNKDQTNKKLLRSNIVQQALYKHAPRLVPTEFKPKCVQTFMTPCVDDKDEDEEEDAKLKKETLKKTGIKGKAPEKGTQDLRKFFTKKPVELDAEDLEYFEIDTKLTQARPGVHTQQKMEKSFDKMKNLFKDLQSPLGTQTQPRKSNQKEPNSNRDDQKRVSMEPIDLCDNSPEKFGRSPLKRRKLESSQGSIKGFLTKVNDSPEKLKKLASPLRCQKLKESQGSLNDSCTLEDDQGLSTERMMKLKQFMETNFTTSKIRKRAENNDLSFHLKSKEMSNDMKYVLLTGHSDFVKQNLEQIKVLNALQDIDTLAETSEEKSIKEIHEIILELFEGLENVEKFLLDVEMDKYKQESLAAEISSEDEEDSEEEERFKLKLDQIFGDLGEPLKCSETFDWVEERFKQTERYKEFEKVSSQTSVQESMVYKTYIDVEMEDDCEDMSFTESKYCSQWQEFNKPDLTFKSTPLHGQAKTFLNLRGSQTQKLSLLTKLEDVNEEGSDVENPENTLEDKASAGDDLNTSNSGKFLESLLMCEKALNTMLLQRKQEEEEEKDKTKNVNSLGNLADDDNSSSRDSNLTTGSLTLLESEFPMKSKFDLGDKVKTPEILSSTLKNQTVNEFPDRMDDADDDDIFQAALEAEMKFTQTKRDSNSLQEPNKTADNLNLTTERNAHELDRHNSSVKLTPPSLNSTPEINEFKIKEKLPKITTNLPTPPEGSLQHELDIVDIEAFMMEPFPEEQELLLKTNARRESLKENFSKETMARQSPDLFADDPSKSPHLLHAKIPAANKQMSLASKLSSKLNVPRCQSSLNPTTSSAFKSPPNKQLLSTKSSSSIPLTSPSNRLSTNSQKNDKSPSLFDMYLKNGKGRVKLPKALINTSSSCLGISRRENETLKEARPNVSNTENDSPIVVGKRSAKASKRKIFDSDSGEEEEGEGNADNNVTVFAAGRSADEDDSDFEEVAATQAPRYNSLLHRRKRRRFNSFIEDEANVSGSENSEDEAEHSIGCYLLDSVVVLSDEDDEDQATTSHMQGMYLQSLKSPPHRRGAFKIPTARVYNDHSHIFSQAPLPEDICSQYVSDSFVVVDDEDDGHANVTEVSMCPLERAEKILKERRRAKRNKAKQIEEPSSSKLKRKRKIHLIDDSSDDQFD